MGMPKKWVEVLCNTHGSQQTDTNYQHKAVKVGTPHNKRQRREGGCPRCKMEKGGAQ